MFSFLNETPHYLVTRKKDKEALKLFSKMAAMNRVLPPEILKEGDSAFQSTHVKEKLISVFKSPTLMKRSLVFFLLWLVDNRIYSLCSLAHYMPPSPRQTLNNQTIATGWEIDISITMTTRIMMITMMFFRFISGFSYYGLNFNLSSMTGSVYINTLIYGLSELSVSILIAFSHQTGRKIPNIVCLLVGGIALILVAVLNVQLDLQSK